MRAGKHCSTFCGIAVAALASRRLLLRDMLAAVALFAVCFFVSCGGAVLVGFCVLWRRAVARFLSFRLSIARAISRSCLLAFRDSCGVYFGILTGGGGPSGKLAMAV